VNADDFVIYVRSKKAAQRVMQSVTRFIRGKNIISHPWWRPYLDFSFTSRRDDPRTRVKELKKHGISHAFAVTTGNAQKGAY